MSIRHIYAKSKSALENKAFLKFLVVFLTGMLIFSLVLVFIELRDRPLVYIRTNEALATSGGGYIASKTGKTYSYPWCGTALRTPAEKRRYFKTREDAEKAGYRPAANCHGLLPIRSEGEGKI